MFNTEQDIVKFIDAAEGQYTKVSGDYEDYRKYYENMQVPEGKPEWVNYIVRNMITDYVNRRVSKLISGRITPSLIGGDEMFDPAKELVYEILEYNNFYENLLEYAANLFEVEGLFAWKFLYDPMILGRFGLGNPRLYALRPGESLLDPNNPNPYNTENDIARIFHKRMLMADAKQKWHEKEADIGKSAEGLSGDETEDWVDFHEIEYKENIIYPAARLDDPEYREYPKPKLSKALELQLSQLGYMPILGEKGTKTDGMTKIEVPSYRVIKTINKTCVVEEPKESGYSGFTIINCFHTFRFQDNTYPQSNVPLIKDVQDQINIIYTLLTDYVKKVTKLNPFITGVPEDEETRIKRKLGKVGEPIFIRKSNVNVHYPPNLQLPAPLTQFLDMNIATLDRIGADYSPSRGEIEGDISGRAILALQSRDDLTQEVHKKHFETALNDLFKVMFECIINKMNTPFKIDREIEGEEKAIYFNYPAEKIEEKEIDQKLNVERNGVINPLEQMAFPKITIDVEMNTMAKEVEELNKAQAALNSAMIAPIDYHKAMYPKKWAEIHKNWKEFSAANQAVQMLVETFGPDIVNMLPQITQIAARFGQQQTDEQKKKG